MTGVEDPQKLVGGSHHVDAVREWLTVFVTDIEAQGGIGQPVAPLIVA